MNAKNKTDTVADKPKLKWRHYFAAIITAYLLNWIAGGLNGVLFHILLKKPYSRFQPPRLTLTLEDFLLSCIPAVINFLILWPFLRSPIKRRIVAVLIVIGWLILSIIFRAETR